MDENFAMNTQSIDSQPEAGSRVRWPIRNQIMLPMVSLMVARLVAVSVLNAFLSVRRTHRRIARELNEVATTLVNPNFRLSDGLLNKMGGLSGAEFVAIQRDGVACVEFVGQVFSWIERDQPDDRFAAGAWRSGHCGGRPRISQVSCDTSW